MKRRSLIGTATAIVASIVLASSALAAGFTNGSLEGTLTPSYPGYDFQRLASGATTIPGWTVTSGDVDWIGTYWQAQQGTKSIDLDGAANGAISQIFDTISGKTYFVSFYLSGNPADGPAIKTLTVNATGGATTTYSYDTSVTGNTLADMKWAAAGYSFTASGATATLTFTSTTTPVGWGPALDNVVVTQVATSGAQCKNGGWATGLFLDSNNAPLTFKNQGDCVSYFATSGQTPIGAPAP